jgi:NADPH-dependent 2,4-dienoyl-CoA reductase/sulfur reductase-like enzyme
MQRHVAILGAGPVGLDAALACADAGWPFTVYEAGDTAAAHVRAWGHVRLFTPWDLGVPHRMRRHLPNAPAGDDCSTGADLADRLLDPIAALPALKGRVRPRTRVAAVARTGLLKHEEIGTDARAVAPFTLLLDTPGAPCPAAAGSSTPPGPWPRAPATASPSTPAPTSGP